MQQLQLQLQQLILVTFLVLAATLFIDNVNGDNVIGNVYYYDLSQCQKSLTEVRCLIDKNDNFGPNGAWLDAVGRTTNGPNCLNPTDSIIISTSRQILRLNPSQDYYVEIRDCIVGSILVETELISSPPKLIVAATVDVFANTDIQVNGVQSMFMTAVDMTIKSVSVSSANVFDYNGHLSIKSLSILQGSMIQGNGLLPTANRTDQVNGILMPNVRFTNGATINGVTYDNDLSYIGNAQLTFSKSSNILMESATDSLTINADMIKATINSNATLFVNGTSINLINVGDQLNIVVLSQQNPVVNISMKSGHMESLTLSGDNDTLCYLHGQFTIGTILGQHPLLFEYQVITPIIVNEQSNIVISAKNNSTPFTSVTVDQGSQLTLNSSNVITTLEKLVVKASSTLYLQSSVVDAHNNVTLQSGSKMVLMDGTTMFVRPYVQQDSSDNYKLTNSFEVSDDSVLDIRTPLNVNNNMPVIITNLTSVSLAGEVIVALAQEDPVPSKFVLFLLPTQAKLPRDVTATSSLSSSTDVRGVSAPTADHNELSTYYVEVYTVPKHSRSVAAIVVPIILVMIIALGVGAYLLYRKRKNIRRKKDDPLEYITFQTVDPEEDNL
ncbi:hypothetical protein SAMD00019534_029950 [Acytostelium subglobosum LB1]|uniref:hypothetical protein n=1 Tax=Acytostelium subglobosum LB1 TaxID=1410327 RepID=UPI000644E9D8|nr:hypothetical protein SAMD00019534_029950 [Acytostelium subglobosum LB1]GAM19820.1 hypothetical protein SAMD00019534_029950 [Acytostelium subglobosum LB1]|eukprot:XP_012756582.1 hypothetical protein SAMD00019534_029950 [Acytostelium subglobosum LB1]